MVRFPIGSAGLVALGLMSAAILAAEPKKPPSDQVIELIELLSEVSEQDTGYSGSTSGAAFLPLGRSESYTMLLGQRPPAPSTTMRSLVKLGVKAVPALLDHLADDRPTKITIEHNLGMGGLFIAKDEGEKGEEKSGSGFRTNTQYTVRVGDLCYVALGQIVNRGYTAVRYQPTAIIYVTCLPKSKHLRDELNKEWHGLTSEKHLKSLATDLESDKEHVREGASVRLSCYYPEAFEPLALKQLARPTYDQRAVFGLIRKQLYPAKSAKDRIGLVDAFVKDHGTIARDGIIWDLFDDLGRQEREEERRRSSKSESKDRYKARECLVEVFGLPTNVKSEDRPKVRPLFATSQARFFQTLVYDRGQKLDQVIRDILAKTDDADLAEGCLKRLVGRGFDADIEAYLKRRLPRMTERDRADLKKYEEKLGWTRLHAAVDLNVPDLVETALQDKLDVNARARNGRTALHLAAAQGNAEAVELLLRAKANPNVKDDEGRLAVELASIADYSEIVRRLVAGKSEVPDLFTAAIVGDIARLSELLKGQKEFVNGRNVPGFTLLHLAAREGHEAAMRQLISAGADVNAIDVPIERSDSSDGLTPLHLAAIAGKAQAAKFLLDKGANVNAIDKRGKLTPLHYAAWAGNAETVKVLLDGKANRDAKDSKDRTPLALAMENNQPAVVKLLDAGK